MKKLLLTGIGLAAAVAWSQGEVIWIEAENFAERGAWNLLDLHPERRGAEVDAAREG